MMPLCVEYFIESSGKGIGLGIFQEYNSPKVEHEIGCTLPHNAFFEILATEGIFGYIMLLFIVYSIMIPILKNKNRESALSLLNIHTLTDTEKTVIIFLIF